MRVTLRTGPGRFLKLPTLPRIGHEARKALGKGRTSDKATTTLRQLPKLDRRMAQAIRRVTLIEPEGAGDIAHLAAQRNFHAAPQRIPDEGENAARS